MATAAAGRGRTGDEATVGARGGVRRLAALELGVFLAALILFTFLIGSVLQSIDHSLATIDSSVQTANEDTHSLPGQIRSITNSLAAIEADVRPVSGQLTAIDSGLSNARDGLAVADSHLGSTSSELTHTEGNLATADNYALRVRNALIADDAHLATAQGQATQAISLLQGVHGDASAIEAVAVQIDDHLRRIAGKVP